MKKRGSNTGSFTEYVNEDRNMRSSFKNKSCSYFRYMMLVVIDNDNGIKKYKVGVS